MFRFTMTLLDSYGTGFCCWKPLVTKTALMTLLLQSSYIWNIAKNKCHGNEAVFLHCNHLLDTTVTHKGNFQMGSCSSLGCSHYSRPTANICREPAAGILIEYLFPSRRLETRELLGNFQTSFISLSKMNTYLQVKLDDKLPSKFNSWMRASGEEMDQHENLL